MRWALPVLLLTLVVPQISEASSREFKRLVEQAERLYKSGKYKDSAERMIEAYAYKPHPNLLYNIARAYDQAGELELALEYYQRYVTSEEGTNPNLLKKSALAMDRLRELVKQRELAREAEAAEQARLEAEARAAREKAEAEAEAKRRAEEQLVARQTAEIEARRTSRSRARIAAFALGGAAVVGLGTGTWFGLQANGSKGRFTEAQTLEEKQRFQSQTRTNALIADVGFGVGIASAVLAVILYPKGSDEDAVLVPSPNGAGVEVRF